MKLIIVLILGFVLLGCKSTPPSAEDIAKKEQAFEALKSRIKLHYKCLDIDTMNFGDRTVLSGKNLKRLEGYQTEFMKTEKHYSDLMSGKIEAKKYLKHAKRLKGYGRDVFKDYIKVSDGKTVNSSILRGHYCERLLVDTDSMAYENKLKEVLDFENPDYDDIKSKAGLTLGKGLLMLVPSSSTVGWEHNREAANEKLKAAKICSCTQTVAKPESATHEALSKLSERLCDYTESKDYQNFLEQEVNVYEEKVKMRNLEVRSVDNNNLIYKYNESKKADVESFFKARYYERPLVHYIKELSPYLAALGGSESDIQAYSCVMEATAKAEFNLLY